MSDRDPSSLADAGSSSNKASIPDISVILTVVEKGAALERCLTALAKQDGSQTIEVFVPYDATIDIGDLPQKFPDVKFLNLGALIPETAPPTAFEEHRLFDRRRAAGLHQAKGKLVAIIEDRGAPQADWAQSMIAEHAASDAAAIGGAIVNVSKGMMERALFTCDFGRYEPPFEAGPREYVSDVNISYKREALESVKHLWKDRYEEATVNWTLQEMGKEIRLSTKPRVIHLRSPMPLTSLIGERYHWGRVFGIMRARKWNIPFVLVAIGASMLAPFIVLTRHIRVRMSKGAPLGEILTTLPALMVLLPSWSAGEAMGYLERIFKGKEIEA